MKVISGGQTGVDAAALRAARDAGLGTGGCAAQGWLTELGPAPWLEKYGLVQCRDKGYAARTRKNAREADATAILTAGQLAGGTLLTYEECLRAMKPVAIIDLDNPDDRQSLRTFLVFCEPDTLNVAGPRESKRPGIGQRAYELLLPIFRTVHEGTLLAPQD